MKNREPHMSSQYEDGVFERMCIQISNRVFINTGYHLVSYHPYSRIYNGVHLERVANIYILRGFQ